MYVDQFLGFLIVNCIAMNGFSDTCMTNLEQRMDSTKQQDVCG
jgi:hypothetical protein